MVQAVIVAFLLGIVAGIAIQKKRSNKQNTDTQVTTTENPIYDSSTSNNNAQEGTTTDTSDNNGSQDETNLTTTEPTNTVVVERDVDYGAMDVPEPTTDDWLYTDGRKIVDSDGNEV